MEEPKKKNWFKRHKILTGILIFILVCGFIGGISGSSNKSESNAQPATTNTQAEAPSHNTQVETTPTPEVITAKVLADDFDGNAVAAEQKWKGKLVEFSGEISNITDSGLSFTNIASKQFSFTQISCKIKDKQQLLPLKNGQTVTVKGTVGDQTVGVIDLKNCEVVQ